MATKDEKSRVVNTAGESPPPEPSKEEPELLGALNGNQNENKEETSNNNLGRPSAEENSKVNDFEQWYKTFQSIIKSIEEESKQEGRPIAKDDKNFFEKQLIGVEETFDTLLEGFDIQTKIKETEDSIEQIRSRLKSSGEGFEMKRKGVSVSQESVLQQFDKMYAEVSDTDLCEIHKDCYEFCKTRFMEQMNMFWKAAKPLTLRQSEEQPNDDASGETQVLEKAYRELARNRVETELQHIEDGWHKKKKNKNSSNKYEDCLEISWVMLILDEPMLIEFEYKAEKKGMFMCKGTEDETPIVFKPAVLLNKENVIRIGEVRYKNDKSLELV